MFTSFINKSFKFNSTLSLPLSFSRVGISGINIQKILFVALYDTKPTAIRQYAGAPLPRARHTAGNPYNTASRWFLTEQVGKSHLLVEILPARALVLCICSQNWDWEVYPGSLPALQQRHNLIVVRVREHIQHARGDRLVGGHARQVSGKGFCVAA